MTRTQGGGNRTAPPAQAAVDGKLRPPKSARRHLVVALKVAVAAGLVAWLVRSGTLDFGALRVFLHHPVLLVANFAVFAGTYLVGSVRWRLLLRTAGIELSLRRAIQLTFTGVFFNVVFPGNVGGDVLKAVYVARDVPLARRPSVFLIALFDRLIALSGLVVVAVVLNAVSHAIPGLARLGEPTTAIAALALVTLVLPAIALIIVRRGGPRLEAFVRDGEATGSGRVSRLIGRLIGATRLVSEQPRALAGALGLSIAIHLTSIVWFAALASAVLDQRVSVFDMAAVYPLGMLSVLLPISYAGFGVGHIAFDQLFAMIGLPHGASVLNVHLIGQIVPCLFGVIPYLTLKREATEPSEPSEARRRTEASG